MIRAQLKGIREFEKNVSRLIKEYGDSSVRGLVRGAQVVEADMERTPPLTPIGVTGNLKQSFFIAHRKGIQGANKEFLGDLAARMRADHGSVTSQSQIKTKEARWPTVILGYSAFYARAIHEMVQKKTWTRPNAGPKWFELALKRNVDNIMKRLRYDLERSTRAISKNK